MIQDHFETVMRLMVAINRIDGAYYLCARKLGVKGNALALLYALNDDRAHSQKQISEDWLIPKTTINTIVKEFTDLGYVTLLAGEHTKEKVITLTENGRAYVDRIMKSVYESEQRAIEQTLQKFSPDFVDAFACFSDLLCDEFQKRILK